MKRWAKVVFGLALAVTVGSGLGYLALPQVVRWCCSPQYEGRLRLEGLRAPVTLEREPSGVVHIRAQSVPDAFFALGVAHAQDRLFQIDLQRHIGAGRLSELFGSATLAQDKFMRTLGLYRAAERTYEGLSPEGKAVVEAYRQGINSYLASDPPLPLEYRVQGLKPRPWSAADVLVWAKVMAFDLSGNWRYELGRYARARQGMSVARMNELLPPYPGDEAAIERSADAAQVQRLGRLELREQALLSYVRGLPAGLLPAERDLRTASNNWAVAGSRTRTGAPLLANDPHLGLSVPSPWYLVHLEAPGYNVIGASVAGLPGVVIGRNPHVAWGVTAMGADVQDLYVLRPIGKGYWYGGRVVPFAERKEVIRVRGGKDVELVVRESVYGPVLNDLVGEAGKTPVALRWVGLEPGDRTLEAVVKLGRVRDWQQFKEALADYAVPTQNFVYADREGNIGQLSAGRFPLRQPGHVGALPVAGTGEYDWRGWVAPAEWPQHYNPAQGFVATANNKVLEPGYPHLLTVDWEQPYRVERIRQLLSRPQKFGLEDMQAMQLDTRSLLVEQFRPSIARLPLSSPEAKAWRQRLLAWDGDMRPELQEPTVFNAWYSELSRLPSREIGLEFWDQPRYLLRALEHGDPNCPGRDCLAYAAQAFERTLLRLGRQVPRWGDAHAARFTHSILTHTPLRFISDRTLPQGGDNYTLERASYDPQTLRTNGGATYRQIVDLANPENSLFMLPTGQSAHLFSPHYSDLLPLWKENRYLPMKTRDYPVVQTLVLEP
ncbi:penicillin acylase family protein [Calidithermus chliarophilus]|uniref:penicillin acylase family protein n=1 Tax=Calidithermus chliarophilus TaxID=52023 RepID=UPI000424E68B|nr:penicillin acylase family protein [Calidithermus chliarophilus]